jgi:hypothetical protein
LATGKKGESKSKVKKVPVDKRIIEELASWGIDKKALGPILLGILVAAIMHQLGVQYSLAPSPGKELTEEEARVEEILFELDDQKRLDRIVQKIPKKTLVQALQRIVREDTDGFLQNYDVDDIPANYPSLPRDLEEFLRRSNG